MSSSMLRTAVTVLVAAVALNYLQTTALSPVASVGRSILRTVMPPKPVKLYGSPLSTCTRRVAMVFRELDVPYELVPIDFSKREHKAIAHMARQPFGQVPVIDDNGFLLYESRAIGRYLAAKHTPNTLVPPQSDLKAWARFEQAASIETANFDPYASGLAYERVFGPAKGESTDERRVKSLLQTLDAKLDAYETILGNSTYLAGDEFTLADLFHLPYGAFVTDRVGFDVLTNPKRPNVVRWWKAISSRPAWLAVKDGA